MKLFNDITRHLLNDERPSKYLNTVKTDHYPFTLFEEMKKTRQSKKHHPEGNVWRHTMLVVDEAAKLKNESKDIKSFMWAALLHDIGKPDTTVIKGNKITAYDHDKVGAIKARDFLSVLTNDRDFIEKVTSLVRWHMQILFVIKDLPFQKINEMKQSGDIEEIALLGYCDRVGRLHADKIKEKEKIISFLKKCKT